MFLGDWKTVLQARYLEFVDDKDWLHLLANLIILDVNILKSMYTFWSALLDKNAFFRIWFPNIDNLI